VSPQKRKKRSENLRIWNFETNIWYKGHCFLLRLTRYPRIFNCHSTLYQRVFWLKHYLHFSRDLFFFSFRFPSSFHSRTFYRNRFKRLGYYYFHFMTDKSLVSLAIILFASLKWSLVKHTQGGKEGMNYIAFIVKITRHNILRQAASIFFFSSES
jgi:hypothetical protein